MIQSLVCIVWGLWVGVAQAEVASVRSTAAVSHQGEVNQFSLEAGMLTNSNTDPYSRGHRIRESYLGTGIRYGRTLLPSVLTRSPLIRDTLGVEAGVFAYRVIDYSGDSLRGAETFVVPVLATARYGFWVANLVHPFLYAGILKNFGIDETVGATTEAELLSSIQPAFGAGVLVSYKGFLARVDLGYDLLGAGLGYQF